MRPKERILSVLEGRLADRVPTSWYKHFPDQRDNTVSDQIAWAEETDADMLCVESDGFMEYDCGRLDLSDPQVLLSLTPHRLDDWYIEGQADRARRIAAGLPDRAVAAMIFTPYSTIKHTIHSETLVMELMEKHPAAMRHAMGVIEQDNFALMEHLAHATGLTGIFISLQNNEIDRYSARVYGSLLAPWDERLLARARELFPLTITHLCAWRGVPNRMQLWRRPYQAVNWACSIEPDLGLKQGRQFFGGESVLMGGFDNRPGGLLHWGNEEQIKACTRLLLENAGPERLILSADCSVDAQTPASHLRWVAEASRDFMAERR